MGQYIVEEIDFLPSGRAGANFGWNRLEGPRHNQGTEPPDAVEPIAWYNHDDGRCAVIGGYVYRGRTIEGLQGAYLYSDFCDGRIRALVQRAGAVAHERADLGVALDGTVSFGQDADGELYLLSLREGVFRIES